MNRERLGRELAHVNRQIENQIHWIADHGDTLPGYVARYGSADDPNRHGNGGEAIYAADLAELDRLTQVANALHWKRGE